MARLVRWRRWGCARLCRLRFFDFGDTARAETASAKSWTCTTRSAYSDRIQFILGPHAIYTVSSDSLRWLWDYAARHGLLIHTHLSETQKVDDCLAAHGKRPVEYLHELGCLGPNLSLAHAIWMTEAEMALLAATWRAGGALPGFKHEAGLGPL